MCIPALTGTSKSWLSCINIGVVTCAAIKLNNRSFLTVFFFSKYALNKLANLGLIALW
jgi:hypothetical protein